MRLTDSGVGGGGGVESIASEIVPLEASVSAPYGARHHN